MFEKLFTEKFHDPGVNKAQASKATKSPKSPNHGHSEVFKLDYKMSQREKVATLNRW